jgi:hypothetical protein
LSENTAKPRTEPVAIITWLFWLKKSQKMPFIPTASNDHMQKM